MALDELAPGERAKLLELFRVLRATRARMDGTMAVEQVAADPQPGADIPATGIHPAAVAAHPQGGEQDCMSRPDRRG